ncbi:MULTISPECIES: GNAT family N-acetyltransferase [Serratia]|uniref:GNAT family N-acetyltransferase n=1 Tax=Serratia TaxID=613 RepID=UPI0013CE70F3|nr:MULTISPECIES: GNAT family N-acetyltransferase [Serratia]
MAKSITDPHDGLLSLQQALDLNLVHPDRCKLHPEMSVIYDTPEGNWRLTYAFIEDGKVKASAVFVISDDLNGIKCFGIGYSVAESFRRMGLATELVEKAIKELQYGLKDRISTFYVEALIGESNIASRKVAEKTLTSSGEPFTEGISGLPAFRYVKLIE